MNISKKYVYIIIIFAVGFLIFLIYKKIRQIQNKLKQQERIIINNNEQLQLLNTYLTHTMNSNTMNSHTMNSHNMYGLGSNFLPKNKQSPELRDKPASSPEIMSTADPVSSGNIINKIFSIEKKTEDRSVPSDEDLDQELIEELKELEVEKEKEELTRVEEPEQAEEIEELTRVEELEQD